MPRSWWPSALAAPCRTSTASLPQSSCCYSWAFRRIVQPCSWCPSRGLALSKIASFGVHRPGPSCPQVEDSVSMGARRRAGLLCLEALTSPETILRQTASENSYSGMPLAFGAHEQSLRILEIPKGTGTMSHQTTHSLLFFSFIYSLLRKISLPLSSAKYKPLGNLHPERSPPSVFLNSHIESQLDLAGDAPGALILNCLWTSVFRRGMVKFSTWHWSACRSRTDVRATLGLTSEGSTWIGGCPELWQWLR